MWDSLTVFSGPSLSRPNSYLGTIIVRFTVVELIRYQHHLIWYGTVITVTSDRLNLVVEHVQK